MTFPEGSPRTRATAVYSAMAILGVVVGLIGRGLLVTYANWRWVPATLSLTARRTSTRLALEGRTMERTQVGHAQETVDRVVGRVKPD